MIRDMDDVITLAFIVVGSICGLAFASMLFAAAWAMANG